MWSMSQSILDVRLDGSEQGKNLGVVLKEWESRYGLRSYFISDWTRDIQVTQSYKDQKLRIALDDILLGTDLNYVVMHNYALVIVKDPSQSIQRKALLTSAAQEKKRIDKMVLGEASRMKRGQNVVVQGTVLADQTKEPLVGASVIVSDLGTGVTTNADGNFELRLAAGLHVITVAYVNYQEQVFDLAAYEDGSMKVVLEENPTMLDELIVQDKTVQDVATSRIGITQINIRDIKKSPALMGEVDLVKQIQTLPGVATAGEAASGFNVRGGSVDQNLILYDGIPVFNSAHVFGFFSTFNSEALRDVNFFRGGIPAEYGGRVSSVLDIRSKEGDNEKWRANGGIGIISSNLLIGGPLVKDKTTLMISGRTTYSDWVTRQIRTNYVDLKNSSVSFLDGTFKLAHKFSNKTKLALSGYLSHDFFRLKGDSSYQWNNKLFSARIDHQLGDGNSLDFTVGVGSYGYQVSDPNKYNGFDLNYGILYPTLRANFYMNRSAHHLNVGIQSTMYDFDPGHLSPSGPLSSKQEIRMDKQRSLESGIFVTDGIQINDLINLDLGMRLSVFNLIGPATIVNYADRPPTSASAIDTVRKASGAFYHTYYGLEPRVSARYAINERWSLKAGYNRIFQYLNLLTNTTAVTPVDVWMPASPYVRPQMADQVSAGLFGSFRKAGVEVFSEVFYKKLSNLLDFRDGAQLLLNPNVETDLLQGKGRAYGAEFSAAKTSGRFTGSVNYTYSRSLRTITGPTTETSINEGREYPSSFDQPHIVNLNWKYGLTKRIFLTGSFTYRSGRPVTIPISAFSIDHIPMAYFSDRNQFRIPDYHRMDIALVFEGSLKRKKMFDGTLIISVYNVYGRKNPYTVFFKEDSLGGLRPYQLSVVGVAFPSVTYTFRIN